MNIDFINYVSPFSWRYGSQEMRRIFIERHKFELWRRIWIALAQAQRKAGLVSDEELTDLKKHETDIDIDRILELEKDTKHDVVAAIREFAEKAKIGGGKIHLGATSMDVVDNADMIRIKDALMLIEEQVKKLLRLFADTIEQYAAMPCMGYTHLQPAEPTTVGYRLAFYAQDLLIDLEYLRFIKSVVKGKGMKGAVGTRASYTEILKGTKLTPEDLDRLVAKELGVDIAEITTQVYPRKFDYLVLSVVASIASSCGKFAEDLRILQSPQIGEWSEPFGKKQVGSSAMPFKKNPVDSEKICSLARYIMQLAPIALQNAMLSHLERTLDDSANKRVIIAESFIALDEILKTMIRVVDGLIINKKRIAVNLAQFAPLATTEVIMIAAVKKGADRQKMHERLRVHALQSWSEVEADKPNPLKKFVMSDPKIVKYLPKSELEKLFDVSHHIGDAPERARKLVKEINKTIYGNNND